MNDKVKCKQQNKKIIIEIGKFISTVAAVATIVQFMINWNNAKVEEQRRLLQYAEDYYAEGNYEAVADILSYDALKNNELVPLNVGVMYAKGYYLPINEERACEYFREAFENGEKYYSIQYLLCYLNSVEECDEIQRLVLAGCKNNNLYLEKLLEMLYVECGMECKDRYIEDFKNKTEKEQLEILNNLFVKVGEKSYKVATGYDYTVYANVDEQTEIEATATEIEERIIDIYVKNYIGKENVEMIFVN